MRWQRLRPFEKFARLVEAHSEGIAASCLEGNKVPLGFIEGPALQQDPRHLAPGLRLTRRGILADDPHLHAAKAVKFTHPKTRRADGKDTPRCIGCGVFLLIILVLTRTTARSSNGLSRARDLGIMKLRWRRRPGQTPVVSRDRWHVRWQGGFARHTDRATETPVYPPSFESSCRHLIQRTIRGAGRGSPL